jgi:hypothetical protein
LLIWKDKKYIKIFYLVQEKEELINTIGIILSTVKGFVISKNKSFINKCANKKWIYFNNFKYFNMDDKLKTYLLIIHNLYIKFNIIKFLYIFVI